MIKNLAGRLKELRIQNKLTQKQVSELLGISPSIISGYETGERTPSAEILLSLSYLYKCSTDYLLGKSNDMPTILLDTNGLTPNQIKAISALIESIRQ
ncbi:XRE family transcriptional regulator [Agathobacter rectalis]|jgi:transcriptional regulator with XRE-family HTH domain|uniref:XRE family transcriptional regulator n=1 Tax=Agathobacter rectalis TaxID=39491 RepID=A0A413QV34_9FIRM|nr:helix-turn-helix transcriptional regulator [Agathobacter rectalis]RHA03306.1 XRE family transcriptional regulator [Agathobacter rectalis]RHA12180.1 XRE family transcriptional regulator [Agathobacter rectalis]